MSIAISACMHSNSKVDLAFNFLQVNRDDDTVRPSFQDYAQDLKVSIFLLKWYYNQNDQKNNYSFFFGFQNYVNLRLTDPSFKF